MSFASRDWDLLTPFERPKRWPERSLVAQTQKVLFLCNCCSVTCAFLGPPPVAFGQRRLSGGRTIVVVAQGLAWSLNGGTVVATAIAQCTLLVGQRRYKGGAREAGPSLWLKNSVYNTIHFYVATIDWPTTMHPFCNHDDACASLLPRLSNLWATTWAVFCLLLWVSSDYAQPITGQITEVTCPVIGRAQPELTPSKTQKTGPGQFYGQPCGKLNTNGIWPETNSGNSGNTTQQIGVHEAPLCVLLVLENIVFECKISFCVDVVCMVCFPGVWLCFICVSFEFTLGLCMLTLSLCYCQAHGELKMVSNK